MNSDVIRGVTVYALPVIFAITVPKTIKGHVARHFGDPSAFLAGRLTINPLRHIDPIGSVVVPLGLLVLALATGTPPLIFGWSKPLPLSFANLRDPKRDMLWVSLAGPAANLAMAIGWAVLLKTLFLGNVSEDFFIRVAEAGIVVNIGFMVLNLLPIPPLDGGRVVASLLPPKLAWRYATLEPYGIWIMLALLFFPPGHPLLWGVLTPVFGSIIDCFKFIFQI